MTDTITIPAAVAIDTSAHPAARFAGWLRSGWQLFRRAPSRLFGLMLLLLAIEMQIQTAIPFIGITLSKIAAGLFGGLFWLPLYRLHIGGRLRLRQTLSAVTGSWAALTGLAVVQLLVFLVQVAAGRLLLGPGALDLLVFARATSDLPPGEFQIGLILAAGVPLSTIMMFSAPLILIDRYSLGPALLTSIRLCLRNAAPMVLVAMMMMLVFFISPSAYLLPTLLLGPWLLCVGLAAYIDVRRQASHKA